MKFAGQLFLFALLAMNCSNAFAVGYSDEYEQEDSDVRCLERLTRSGTETFCLPRYFCLTDEGYLGVSSEHTRSIVNVQTGESVVVGTYTQCNSLQYW